jgi:hypothetical protein
LKKISLTLGGTGILTNKRLDTIIEKNLVRLESILSIEEIDRVLPGSD